MKKHINKLAFLVAVISIYSCGTTTDFTVVKRKYNPGFNLSFGKKVNHVEPTAAEKQEQVVAENKNEKTTPVTESFVEPTAASSESTSSLKQATFAAGTEKTITAHTQKTASPSNHNLVKAIALKKASKAIAKLEKKAKSSSSEDISNETILLIILSLFPILALIAMYLKDGKKITNNFWIDLVLHLTIVGYAVFAVLVVLDVINLA
jgi:cobalamin biosynthesis Mg chelatase CobN